MSIEELQSIRDFSDYHQPRSAKRPSNPVRMERVPTTLGGVDGTRVTPFSAVAPSGAPNLAGSPSGTKVPVQMTVESYVIDFSLPVLTLVALGTCTMMKVGL